MTGEAFKDWARANGFNGMQLAKAAASVGFTVTQGRQRSQSIVRMPEIELRGLTAAYLGLPPWEPGLADALDADALAMVRLARREIERCIAQRRVEKTS